MNLERAKLVDRTVGALAARVLGLARGRPGGRRAPEVTRVRSILLIKLWGMGNVVLLQPVIREIRATYRGARILFLTLASNRELLDRQPDVDRVLTLEIASWGRLARALPRLVGELRREAPDLVCDFEQFCHLSGILAALSGASQTIGFRLEGTGRGRIYNVGVPYREERHMGSVFADIARAAGVPPFHPRPASPAPSPSDVAEAARLLGPPVEGEVLIAVHPGSGDNFPGRRWPAASFAGVVRALVGRWRGARVILTGGEGERGLTAGILRAAARDGEAAPRVLDLAGGTSPASLAAVLARCRLLVSNDTGPVHLASAIGVPVFAFFGPNTPRLYGPTAPGSRVFYLDLPCSPCITNANGKSSSCRMPVCMRGIHVEKVVEAIVGSGLLGPQDPVPGHAAPKGVLR